MKACTDCLKCLCLLAAVFALVEAGLAFRDIGRASSAAMETVDNVAKELGKTAAVVSEYAR